MSKSYSNWCVSYEVANCCWISFRQPPLNILSLARRAVAILPPYSRFFLFSLGPRSYRTCHGIAQLFLWFLFIFVISIFNWQGNNRFLIRIQSCFNNTLFLSFSATADFPLLSFPSSRDHGRKIVWGIDGRSCLQAGRIFLLLHFRWGNGDVEKSYRPFWEEFFLKKNYFLFNSKSLFFSLNSSLQLEGQERKVRNLIVSNLSLYHQTKLYLILAKSSR